jgi:hypothetical protein
MAYVGTPSYLGSDVTTLAGILQGESSTADGQQAVASVMANRLSTGGFLTNSNYGGILGIALGQNQFQGQVTNPNSQSISIAQQALSGTLPDNTNGALFYGAPANGNASWLNNLLSSGTGLKIGGNTFSDQQGPASAAYQAGIAGGSTGGSTLTDADIVDPNFDYPGEEGPSTVGASAGDQFSLFSTPSTPTGATSGFNSLSAGSSGLGGGSSLFGDAGGTGDSVTVASGGSVPTPTDAEIDDAFGGSNPAVSSGAGSAAGAAAGAGGIAVNLTDESGLPSSITSAGNAAKAGATQAGSDITGASSGITGTSASIFNNFQTYASGALIVVALVLAGLIFVAFGLGMFKHDLVAKIA